MIYKRGSTYWYKFTFNGEAIRESTRQKNQHTARQMEAAHRTSACKGRGWNPREECSVPIVSEFLGEGICALRGNQACCASLERSTYYKEGCKMIEATRDLGCAAAGRSERPARATVRSAEFEVVGIAHQLRIADSSPCSESGVPVGQAGTTGKGDTREGRAAEGPRAHGCGGDGLSCRVPSAVARRSNDHSRNGNAPR